MRIMTLKSYSEHTETIFKHLEILKIFQVNDFLTSLFMFRYFNLKIYPKHLPTISQLIMMFVNTIQGKNDSFA